MSISTGTGDNGKTSLWSGERVGKDDLRVDVYGTLDELNAFLGEAYHYIKSDIVKNDVEFLQKELFRVGGEIASKSKPYKNPITGDDIKYLNKKITDFEKKIKFKGFVVPGQTKSSAKLDICRTISRRAERLLVKLTRKEEVSSFLLKYLNRLSDFLFLLARFEEAEEGKIKYL